MTPRKILGLGQWKGHPQGKFEITPSMLDSAYDYFNRRGVKLPANYEHDRKTTAGWITSLEKKPDGLYATVEHTSKATEDIKEDQYPYISPEILFNQPDEVTGEKVPLQVCGLAITKMPFMHDLGETRLNSKGMVLCSYDINGNEVKQINNNQGENMQELVDKINAALAGLELPAESDPMTGLAKLEEFAKAGKSMIAVVGVGTGGEAPTPEQAVEVMPEMVANHKVTLDLSKTLECKPGELKSKVSELAKPPKKGEKVDDTKVTELSKKVDDQDKQIVDLKKEAQEARLEVFLSKNDKKITAGMKEGVSKSFMENEAFVVNFYKEQPDILPADIGTPVETKPENLATEDKEFAELIGISAEDMAGGSGPNGMKYFENKKKGAK